MASKLASSKTEYWCSAKTYNAYFKTFGKYNSFTEKEKS